jgi:hypothetical protein
MIASRSSVAAAAVLVAVLVLASPLDAQDAVPLDIVPQPRSTAAPAEPLAEAPAEAPRDVAQPAEEPVVSEGVEVDTVRAADPEAVGLYEEAEGGFGFDMWQGSSRALVERMLPQLPAGTTSRVVNDLMRRLLLSTAAPPEGPRSAGLLALRVERLAAMGEGVAMTHLLRSAPPELYDATLARAQLDALLLTSDNVGACAQARELVRHGDVPYWDKVQIFCRALAGQHDEAELGVALLRERGGLTNDPSFLVLLRALNGDPGVELASLRHPTALHLAMLQSARLKVPEDAVETADPAIARAIAFIANAPLELRLRAAERAEAMGALPIETLVEFYASVPFTPEDLANPLSRAEASGGAMTRALLYQSIAKQVVPAARAEVLRAIWRLGRETDGWNGFATASRVVRNTLLELRPSPELVSIAGDAARALFAIGQPAAARAWLDLAEAQSGVNAEAAATVTALWPIAKLADARGDLPWDGTRLTRWWDAQGSLAEPIRRQRAAALFGLMGALGQDVPASTQLLLLNGPAHEWTRAPTSALWAQLDAAAGAGRVGETVLLALVTLDASAPTPPAPLTLMLAISSLYRVGLAAEAHAVALEAALGRGL